MPGMMMRQVSTRWSKTKYIENGKMLGGIG
jgi:hypothetical protein